MSSNDSVHIDPAVAAGGIQAWEAADSSLDGMVTSTLSTIEGLEAGSPWGSDAAGAQFAADYPASSAAVAQAIRDVGTRLHEIGSGARTAIGASLASDEEQAAPVRATDGQFTGQAQPPGGGGASGGSGGGPGGSGGSGGTVNAIAPAGGRAQGAVLVPGSSRLVSEGAAQWAPAGAGERSARPVSDGAAPWTPGDGGSGNGQSGGIGGHEGGGHDAGGHDAGGQRGGGAQDGGSQARLVHEGSTVVADESASRVSIAQALSPGTTPSS